MGYYVTAPRGLVECPPDGKNSFLSLLQDEIIQERYSVARGIPEVVDLSREITRSPAVDDEKPKAMMFEESYWDSPEAKKLFLGDSNDERSVVNVLEQRIEWLQQANRTPDGWRDLIDKHDNNNLCSSYDIFIIRQRCSILCLAYTYTLEEMNSARWIEYCCSRAIDDETMTMRQGGGGEGGG